MHRNEISQHSENKELLHGHPLICTSISHPFLPILRDLSGKGSKHNLRDRGGGGCVRPVAHMKSQY